MDSFEWNKVFGAVLGTVLFILAVRVAAETIYHHEPLVQQVYVVQGVQHDTAPATPAAPTEEALPDFATVIPAANLAAGEAAAAPCAVCHTWTKGGPNNIGPNLFGVIGRQKASHAGFAYSPAMQAKGGEWSYAEIFRFLRSPPQFVPGNKMAFGGLARAQDRINVIAFLRSQADAPAPLPPPQPAAAATGATAPPAEAPAAQATPTTDPHAQH